MLTCAILLLLSIASCQRKPARSGDIPPDPPKNYASTREGLHELWSDILVAAKKDERQQVHDLLASMIMIDEDLVALFGPERARYLAPRYRPMIGRLVNFGAIELVTQVYEHKYDDIEIYLIDGSASPSDRAILDTISPGTTVYGLRIKRKGEKLGLRYDFFVFRRGRWLTGNLLGKYLIPSADGGVGGLDAGVRNAP